MQSSAFLRQAGSLLPHALWISVAAFLVLPSSGAAQGLHEVALPPGIKAEWSLAKAHRERTPTRERISINGLWRWQPADDRAVKIPTDGWGFYKVPAPWPGIQDYMQSDYQTLFRHTSWQSTNPGQMRSAWHERSITIPDTWSGRRIALDIEYVNSFARVFVDGQEVGQLRFPGGQVDLSRQVRPGATHVLSLLVVALPLRAVMESYTDTNAARQEQGTVERRGLCGDAWLVSTPDGPRLGGLQIAISFREAMVSFKVGVEGLAAGRPYTVRARILEGETQVAEFIGPAITEADRTNGITRFAANWKPERLWDIHTPQNQYSAELSLLDSEGKPVDTLGPERFGFREFWIEGRDFYLNGSRLFLSAVPLDNAQVGAALATYAAARESFIRLQSFGINFVYTHNYGCEPGSHLSFAEILKAADDTGMLVALSQPHFSAYEWKSPDADRTNGYAKHAAFYVQVAGNHPSVVSYSMSHNATGYNEDMDPLLIDGVSEPRDQWSARNAAVALRCEAIVKQLDPARLVYHHSSGNLSSMHTVNFYPNFVPMQELDDWFEHWARNGVKPVLLVEYGAPFGWDWTMYRGWFDGKREFGSAAVPWEYCLAEWNAQFLGDSAYRISEREKRNLRWEAQKFRERHGWHRWDYPYPVGDERLDELQPVQAAYTTSNWRAYRTWGLSGNSPWEHDRFWKLRDGFKPSRQDLAVDWEDLQRPGYSPDFIDRTYARFDLAYDRTNWVPTPTAESLLRNNGPLLVWLAGRPERFTTKEHTFYPGEFVSKQLIIVNNSRTNVSGEFSWSSDLADARGNRGKVSIETGDQARVPVRFQIPPDQPPGACHIEAAFVTETGEEQRDAFTVQIVARPDPQPAVSSLALFDPRGETTKFLSRLGAKFQTIDASADLSHTHILVIGKGALDPGRAAPPLTRVREGLKVIVFEQSAAALEQRLGFRVAEYGLRQVWRRLPDSPLLAGLTDELLRDWRGAATLVPPTLDYTLSPRYNGAPAVRWCDLEVPRLWRCGNWGNVASVLIEKPPRGDFLPVIEGGYALQYSPLLEYREGRGMVLFCQVDVTARTDDEPAAEILTRNLLRYVEAWRPRTPRTAVYAGEAAGRSWLAAVGIDVMPFNGQVPTGEQLLILTPGAGQQLASVSSTLKSWIDAGGRVLAVGLGEEEANGLFSGSLNTEQAEHIAAHFAPFGAESGLAGISPADVHNRDPRTVPLVSGGANRYGNGVLASRGNVVFFQLRPWEFENGPERFNQRRTFVRTSFALSRVLANLGVSGATPLLDRFGDPVRDSKEKSSGDRRWLEGLYLTKPVEWDDPYRFFRW